MSTLPGAETWRCPSCQDTTAPLGMCQKCFVFGLRYEDIEAAILRDHDCKQHCGHGTLTTPSGSAQTPSHGTAAIDETGS